MSAQGGPPPGIDTGAAGSGGRPEGLRGWIDPNFPVENFQGPKDAPIIIYGYVDLSYSLAITTVRTIANFPPATPHPLLFASLGSSSSS